MTRARDDNSNNVETEDFRALDALVLAELEALERAAPRHHRARETEKEQRRAEDNVVFKESWGAEAEVPAEPVAPPPIVPVAPVEGPSAEAGEESVPELTFEETEEQSESDLFTLEERTFITRTSDWLRQRENKDMIMSRIWALVTESDAGSFFKAEDTSGAATEERPETDAAAGPSSDGDDQPQG